MRLRSWLFLSLGIVLALLTGIALNGVAQRSGERAAAAPLEVETILVASTDVPARTVLQGSMLASREFPKALVPAGAIASEAEAAGQTTLATIPSGAPILRGQLVAADGKSGASLTLDPGSVLVSFPTNDPLTAGGFVSAGDRVDILATVTTGAGENPKRTQTIVQNLEVRQVIGPTKEQPQRATALTFIVDHQTALVLKYLRDSAATIDLAVRSRAEPDNSTTRSVDITYLVQTFGIAR
ncbi:MAG: Flp pilus assembly protein CpaB [Chloroflexi bacterium]|nr:MAG: Flp pilus assembly protein CpaB [Chloroflexota bacterium]